LGYELLLACTLSFAKNLYFFLPSSHVNIDLLNSIMQILMFCVINMFYCVLSTFSCIRYEIQFIIVFFLGLAKQVYALGLGQLV
jgi:hypothetical protein